MDDPFYIKCFGTVPVEYQGFVEWSPGRIKPEVAQNRRGKPPKPAQVRHICQPDQRCAHCAQIPLSHVPTRFALVPDCVVFPIANKPIGAPDYQTHSSRNLCTRWTIPSRSCGVHSGGDPSTASTSIRSKTAISPPNSGGATRSSLATSPPLPSKMAEPAWASAKSSSKRDGASFNAIAFTIQLKCSGG